MRTSVSILRFDQYTKRVKGFSEVPKVQEKSIDDVKQQWEQARRTAAPIIEGSLAAIGGKSIADKMAFFYSMQGREMLTKHLAAIMDAGEKVQAEVDKFSRY